MSRLPIPLLQGACWLRGAATMAAFVAIFSAPSTGNARAEGPRVPLKRLAVDCVTIKDGPRLLGRILGSSSDREVTIAVQRAWLAAEHPAYYKSVERDETARKATQAKLLPQRIRDWIAQRDDGPDGNIIDQGLVHVLKEELARIENAPRADKEKAEPAQFVLLTIPVEQIQFSFVQPAAQRQVALVAWRERLRDVEERSALALARELQEKKMELSEAVDLSDRLPDAPDDDRQWAARQALFEHAVGRRLEFQGTGELLIRTDHQADAPLDLEKLLTGLLQSQLQQGLLSLLVRPESKPAAPKREFDSAKTIAERESLTGFSVTRVAHDLPGRRVSVDVRFLAQMPDGSWETIWKHTAEADAGVDRKELEQRIADDPRVAKVFGLLNSLGGTEADSMRATALRFATATMEAQERAQRAFFEYRSRYSDRLDGPALRWTSPEIGGGAD